MVLPNIKKEQKTKKFLLFLTVCFLDVFHCFTVADLRQPLSICVVRDRLLRLFDFNRLIFHT